MKYVLLIRSSDSEWERYPGSHDYPVAIEILRHLSYNEGKGVSIVPKEQWKKTLEIYNAKRHYEEWSDRRI